MEAGKSKESLKAAGKKRLEEFRLKRQQQKAEGGAGSAKPASQSDSPDQVSVAAVEENSATTENPQARSDQDEEQGGGNVGEGVLEREALLGRVGELEVRIRSAESDAESKLKLIESLRSSLEQCREDCCKAEGISREKDEELLHLGKVAEELKTEKESLSSQVMFLRTELESSRQQAEEAVAVAEEKVSDRDEEIGRLKTEVESRAAMVEELLRKSQGFCEEIEALKGQLRKASRNASELQAEKSHVQSQLEQAAGERGLLQRQLQDQESRARESETEFQRAVKATEMTCFGTLENFLRTLDGVSTSVEPFAEQEKARLKDFQASFDVLEAKMDSHVASLVRQLSEREDQNRDWRSKMQVAAARISQQEARIRDLLSNERSMQEDLFQAKSSREHLALELAAAVARLREFEDARESGAMLESTGFQLKDVEAALQAANECIQKVGRTVGAACGLPDGVTLDAAEKVEHLAREFLALADKAAASQSAADTLEEKLRSIHAELTAEKEVKASAIGRLEAELASLREDDAKVREKLDCLLELLSIETAEDELGASGRLDLSIDSVRGHLQQLGDLKVEVDRLDDDKLQLQDDLARKMSELKMARGDLEGELEKSRVLFEKVGKLENQLASAASDGSSCKEKLDAAVALLQQENSQLRDEVLQLQDVSSRRSSELETARTGLEDELEKSRVWSEQAGRLETQLADVRACMTDLDAVIAELQKDKLRLHDELESQKLQSSELKTELERSTEKVGKLEAELASVTDNGHAREEELEAVIARLRESQLQLQDELEGSKLQLQALGTELEASRAWFEKAGKLEAQLASETDNGITCKKELESVVADKVQLQDEVERGKLQLRENTSELEMLRSERRVWSERVGKLETRLASVTDEGTAFKKERNAVVARLQADKVRLQDELERSEVRLQEQTSALEMVLEKSRELSEQVGKLETRLTSVTDEGIAWKEELDAVHEDKLRLQDELELSRLQLRELTSELEKSRVRESQLEDELERSKLQLQNESARSMSEVEVVRTGLESELEKSRVLVRTLETQLASATSDGARLQQELLDSDQRVVALREKLGLAIKKGKGLAQQREELRQELAQKSAELVKLSNDKLEESRSLGKSFAEQEENLQVELKSLNLSLRTKQEELDRLLDDSSYREKSLTAEVAVLRRKSAELLEEKQLLEESKREAWIELRKLADELHSSRAELRIKSEAEAELKSSLVVSEERSKKLEQDMLSAVRSLESELSESFEKKVAALAEVDKVAKDLRRLLCSQDNPPELEQPSPWMHAGKISLQSIRERNEFELSHILQITVSIRRLLGDMIAAVLSFQRHCGDGGLESVAAGLEIKEQDYAACKASLATRESELESLIQEKDRLSVRAEELEDLLDHNDSAMGSMEMSRNKAVGKLTFTLGKLNELQQQCEAMLAEIERLQSSLDVCHLEISGLNQKVAELETESGEKGGRLLELWSRLEILAAKSSGGRGIQADPVDALDGEIQRLQRQNEKLELSGQSKDAEVQRLRKQVEQLAGKIRVESEIEEVEEQPKHIAVASAPHFRSQKKTPGGDQVFIDMEAQVLSAEEKGSAFKSLATLRFFPKAGHHLGDQIDALCSTGGRALMRLPAARLSLILYWIAVHVWMVASML